MPYPADYGGVIDVFFRIKALHSLGVKVILHTFTYGRPQASELEELCSEVHYYPRRMGFVNALGKRPYIVASRDCRALVEELKRDDYPVLLEGLHCCSVLEALPGRTVFVRAHNVEHDYYQRLANTETDYFKRLYYITEARKLQRYEKVMVKATAVLSVTKADAAHFERIGCRKVVLMPSSHIDDDVVATPSPEPIASDAYAIYHADLSVPENIKALKFLSVNVFSKTSNRIVVAGRNPSPQLRSSLETLPNVSLVANPDTPTMQGLIANAQVQLLVTDMPTGLKLKLLNSLYGGRHCLVNNNMVAGTRLGELCTVADSGSDLLAALERLMQTPFTEEDITSRRQLLGSLYSNQANARILLDLMQQS